ncbi:hypothetical protein SARC_10224 [Sphaeroforma arctica JP610]|uniref:Major facilitator superfamily (MFS) profile domain-containing protein n=1 Tax=Sphaeroforma arctica JP610 TaxID=667725 RepID=A0A0L0FLE9_9EUKA|nr:hypothetical protein SARC_10224 [Sphaeroforma arctica JP610]KNC77316.1 hypothetical protein SARC_10224 [Sphaeroforma arctica JP610]|eukprot:XP_014151218.1 hypothetical protein SARC_10224 [Sphaeroforma arctica JP610]
MATLDEKKGYQEDDTGTSTAELVLDDDDEVESEFDESYTASIRDINLAAWMVFTVELGERLSFYSTKNVYLTFTQEMLGMSSANYNLLMNFNSAMNYGVFLLMGGYLADSYMGNFKVIAYLAPVYLVGKAILWMTAIPGLSFDHYPYEPTWGEWGFYISITIMGVGAGFIKPCISVFAAEQLRGKDGSDAHPKLVELVYQAFYFCINVGAFIGQFISPILVSEIEQLKMTCGTDAYLKAECQDLCYGGDFCLGTAYPPVELQSVCCYGGNKGTGYWIAWGFTLFLFCGAFVVFYVGAYKPGYVKVPPQGSALTPFYRTMKAAKRNKVAPEDCDMSGPISWANRAKSEPGMDYHEVDKVRLVLHACKPFVFYLLFWWANLSPQDYMASMCLKGFYEVGFIDCNQVSNANALAILIGLPACVFLFYPMLRKMGFSLKPMHKATFGMFIVAVPWMFLLGFYYYMISVGTFTGTDVTSWVDDTPATDSRMNILWLAIPYGMTGLSEIFLNVPLMELAYSQTPVGYKGITMAITLMSNFFGYVIPGFIVNPFFTAQNQVIYYWVTLVLIILQIGWMIYFSMHYVNGRDLCPELYDAKIDDDDVEITSTHKDSLKQ